MAVQITFKTSNDAMQEDGSLSLAAVAATLDGIRQQIEQGGAGSGIVWDYNGANIGTWSVH